MTLFLTFIFLAAIFVTLVFLRSPLYRLDKTNLIQLFELVLDKRASQHDWNVFIEMPIRHDTELEQIRQRCAALTELEGHYGAEGFGLTKKGRKELRLILEKLKNT